MIYFTLIFITKSAIAQINDIDTIGFGVNFHESYLKAYVSAGYVKGTDTSKFEIIDTLNYTFKWASADAGTVIPDIDTLPRAIYNFKNEGTYNVNLTVFEKTTGTTFTFNRQVVVQEPIAIEVPNVFSPNGDGINDLFKVFYDGSTELEITIFTRTGTKVFELVSPTIVWDGRNSSGSKLSKGVYYYILSSKDPLIPVHKGFIHLYPEDVDE